MAGIARRTLAILTLLAAVLYLPGSYDGSDEAAPDSSPSPTPTASSTPDETASPSPEPSPTATASPSPTATASPSPAPSPNAEGAQPQESSSELAIHLVANPTEVTIGETVELAAQVQNTSGEGAENVEAAVSFSNELVFVSSSPNGAEVAEGPGGTSVTFDLGSLDASESTTVVVVAEAADATATSMPVESSVSWDDGFSSAQVEITIVDQSMDLGLSSTSPGLLAETGEVVTYRVDVTNKGTGVVRDLAIVDLVPDEIHVLGAGFAPGVDAVQVGSSGGKEDIVWIIGKLAPGAKVELSWTGTVEDSGDLLAENRVRAMVDEVKVATTQDRSYLASGGDTSANSPRFKPMKKRVVTTKRVATSPPRAALPEGALGASGGLLPLTGTDLRLGVAMGTALVLLGALMAWVVPSPRSRRRVGIVCLVVLLAAIGCTSDDDSPPDGPDARVKGKQIQRGETEEEPNDVAAPDQDVPDEDARDGQGRAEAPEPADGDDDQDDDGLDEVTTQPPVAPVPPEPSVEVVRRTRVVVVEANDLPVVSPGSAVGDAMPAGWDDSSGRLSGDLRSASSVTKGVWLKTTLRAQGGGILAEVVLTNVSPDARLSVEGRLGLKIQSSGAEETLRGSKLSQTLNPKGEATARFRFRLPNGSFNATPLFQS